MHRVSITVEPAVYQLLKNKVNRSKYISELVLQDAYAQKKDVLLERTKDALLKDPEFLAALRERVGTISSTPHGVGLVGTMKPIQDRLDVRYTGAEDAA